MDAIRAILSRRSIRMYTNQAVSDDMVQSVIEAAMSAPSAGNERPWHFIVIRARKTLDAIPEFHPYAKTVLSAPLAILVCGDLSLETHEGFWVQDCAAATENMLIAVAAMDLGAVWLGVYPREDRVDGMRNLLGIPGHVIPFALVPIGFPDEYKDTVRHFNAMRVHYEWWAQRPEEL